MKFVNFKLEPMKLPYFRTNKFIFTIPITKISKSDEIFAIINNLTYAHFLLKVFGSLPISYI